MQIKAAFRQAVTVRTTFNQAPLSMLAFFHRRAKQRTVMLTLAAWVFALMAGVVNACVLQVKLPADHHAQAQTYASASEVIDTHAHLAVLPHSAAPSPTDDPSGHADSSKAQCKNFCDVEASAAAAKPPGHDATDPSQAPMYLRACTPFALPLATAKQSFDDRPPPCGAPMVIRFLRLTI